MLDTSPDATPRSRSFEHGHDDCDDVLLWNDRGDISRVSDTAALTGCP